jgi:hypothetical protein
MKVVSVAKVSQRRACQGVAAPKLSFQRETIMRMNLLARAVVAVLISAMGAVAAKAQSAEWSDLQKNPVFSRGSRIWVVTDAEPQVRQPCRINALDSDRVVCSERSGRNRLAYRKEDILAMIEPAHHEHLLRFWLKGMVPGVGLIVAGALLSGPGAIAAIVVGSLVVFLTTDSVAWSNGDYPERLLYLQPGKSLPLKLGH